MELTYLKLDAKKNLVNNQAKLFFASIFPYVTIFSLAVLNYYLYYLLRKSDFSFIPYASSYADVIRPILFTVSIALSVLLWRASRLCANKYFFLKSRGEKATFAAAVKSIGFKQCLTFLMTDILRFFLSLAWLAFYFAPSAITGGILFYALKTGEYGNKVLLTLFVSCLMLFVVGTVFFYITLKRYSMCEGVIFSEKETDSLRVIEKSIELMEGNTVKYARYCVSFWGWKILCLLLIPLV
ncbi:MAG: DUF975 family protein, partial [Candidatus Fimenecus sp.]